jgi:hypothetical protein
MRRFSARQQGNSGYLPLNPKLKIEAGSELHVVDPGGDSTTFSDARLGIVFHF